MHEQGAWCILARHHTLARHISQCVPILSRALVLFLVTAGRYLSENDE